MSLQRSTVLQILITRRRFNLFGDIDNQISTLTLHIIEILSDLCFISFGLCLLLSAQNGENEGPPDKNECSSPSLCFPMIALAYAEGPSVPCTVDGDHFKKSEFERLLRGTNERYPILVYCYSHKCTVTITKTWSTSIVEQLEKKLLNAH